MPVIHTMEFYEQAGLLAARRQFHMTVCRGVGNLANICLNSLDS